MERKERELVKAEMQRIAQLPAESRQLEMARLFGDVYDVELPIPDLVAAVSDVVRADVGEDVDFLVPETVDKSLFTLTSNCNVTQTKVSPSADQELAFTDLISDERFTCLHDWLKGKHNVLRLHADAISEAMNRQENISIINLLDAGATAAGNLFTLDSGKTKFDFPKLVEMAKSLRKFGSRLVLITGCNVATDIDLLDFDSDKQREHGINLIVDEWIRIEDYSVNIDGTPTTVIGLDDAYLVAISDSGRRKPILFARRKTNDLASMADTEAVAKERIMITNGNMINVAADRKFSQAIVGFQEFGAVLLNNNVVAKFTRS